MSIVRRIICEDVDRKRIEVIVNRLKRLDDHEPHGEIHYIKKDGDDLGGDYETCGKIKCIEKCRSRAIDEFDNCELCFDSTDNFLDFESIDRCSECGEPLNESLSWVKEELDHYAVHVNSYKDVKESAFDLRAIFQSYPTCDEEISEYAVNQFKKGNKVPYYQGMERQEKFKNVFFSLLKRVEDFFKEEQIKEM